MYLQPTTLYVIGLLSVSNLFMTFAWYGHLKFKTVPLYLVIIVSWLIALCEYVFQVPANRLGHGHFSAAELKTLQEVISLSMFAIFSVLYLGEPITLRHGAGFLLIALGAGLIFQK